MFDHIHFVNAQIMIELLLAEHLFAHFLNRRTHYPLRLIASCSLCLAVAFLFPVPEQLSQYVVPFGTLMYLWIFFCSGIGILLCYSEDLWSILFCCAAGYTVQHLASSLHDPVRQLLQTLRVPFSAPAAYLLTLLIPYIICYYIFSRDIKRLKKIHVDSKRLLVLSIVVVVVDIIASLVLQVISSRNMQIEYVTMLQLYGALSCVFILSVQFGLLSNRSLELELGVVSQMLQEEEKQYQLAQDNIDIVNQKCHDLKHQIRTLRTEAEVIDRDALKEIEQAVGIYDASVKTGNRALDVILTEKQLLCEGAGIMLTCMAEGDAIQFMSPGDIYSLFGNALDNAIEAVSRLPDPEQRTISVSVIAKGQMVSIHAENYFSGTLEFEEGLPQTIKEDKAYHGFGMRSMRTVAEKYGGYLTAKAQSGVFHLNLVIPIPST